MVTARQWLRKKARDGFVALAESPLLLFEYIVNCIPLATSYGGANALFILIDANHRPLPVCPINPAKPVGKTIKGVLHRTNPVNSFFRGGGKRFAKPI